MMITLDTSLKSVLPAPHRLGQRVGIELEYEKFSRAKFLKEDLLIDQWRLENDPSLRGGGIELISDVLPPDSVDEALEEAKAVIKASGAKATNRCGVHVHLNMTDVTIKHLWNLVTLYVLAEPTIFKHFADGRELSHFCVPLWCNAHFAQALYTDIKKLRMGIRGGDITLRESPLRFRDLELGHTRNSKGLGIFHCIKYSALNFKPLTTLGTIEFRQHPATVDMRKVKHWVTFLLRLRDVAGTYDDPLDILDEYEKNGLISLTDKLHLNQEDIDEIDQDEAEDVATMAAGHIPVPWEELSWEMK